MPILRYDVNCSIIFSEIALHARPAAAAAAGFGAVEFWWPFGTTAPADSDVDAFVSAIHDSGTQLVSLNFAAGDMAAGDRGLASWRGRSGQFRDSVDVAIGIGQRLGCRSFNALYGNRMDGAEPVQQDARALANLLYAARAAAAIGGQVLIEPVSGAERYPLLTAADALAVVNRVNAASGLGNCALLADLYHLAINGDDLDATITAHAASIGHVQIADAPGRGEPGSGSLAIEPRLTRLAAAGYNGWVGLEYRPTGNSADSFAWLPRPQRSAGQVVAAAQDGGQA
jgi:hydroxypyruvate isomerase